MVDVHDGLWGADCSMAGQAISPLSRQAGIDFRRPQTYEYPVYGEETGSAYRAHSEAAYRLGSDLGSPNHGNTLLSKRVTEQIRSPVRLRTRRPVPWRMPVEARR